MYQEHVVYHLYNHSNNFEVIFRSYENYVFFLGKIRKHLLPVADILCYCLMPDHFHFMIIPKAEGCLPSGVLKSGRKGDKPEDFQQVISQAIKIILSSYTKSFNRRYNRRGSLFRAKTKAKPAYTDFVSPGFVFRDGYPLSYLIPYLRICFDYIHNNPVKADLALRPEEWEFSSAIDYAGLREGTLCNYALAEHLIGVKRKVL